MPLDPAAPLPSSPEQRNAERLRDLERRVAELERGRTAPIGSAAPTDGREGDLRGQSSTPPRLWLRVGGAWHYTTLT